jgi:UDP-glucose 4-epimerase
MQILVTGGAGFIGSHLVDVLLEAGHAVDVIDDLSSGRREKLPAGVALHVADVRDKQTLTRVFNETRPEAVFHEAAQLSVARSVREPAFDAEVNLMGILNVLENSIRVGTRKVVFASSGGVLYGDVAAAAPETTPSNPISPYGISKWASEQYLQFFAREHGLKTVALRYSNVYGPRQNPHGEAGVVAIFAERMLSGEQVTINGDGRYIRDYVYAVDVARANLLALERELPGPFVAFNVGTSTTTDVNVLADKMRALSMEVARRRGKPLDVPQPRHGPHRAGDLRSSVVSIEKAREYLGWSPKITLDDGLRETIEWFAARGAGF